MVDITVPQLGESVTEATVAKWHKQPGDTIQADEILVELETDKVNLEVNAPVTGVVQEVKVKEGDNVEVGDILGMMEEKAIASTASANTANDAAKQSSTPDVEQSAPAVANAGKTSSAPMSPSANKLANEKGVDPTSIKGSGKGGRITKADVINAKPATVTTDSSVVDNSPREERVKMTRLRKTIAQRLKESQNTAAILSTFNEVDLGEVMRIRKEYQERFIEKHGVKLGFMSFFIKAVVAALKELPAVNAEIDGDDIVYKNHYDIGVAVGTDQGLVVPVLRDADRLSFAEIEKGVAELGKKARAGQLTMQDMSGGTFSITNGGTYGSLLSTPIINPPQSGILGMHNIVERPMARNGQVEIRPMMYIALSYDHRIIDGKEAVTFLVRIKQLIENPEKLLFDI
jgi:2-oxoglutarate dehydrogenase E2 component (dihydrolipoamide succinyltransferase)